MTLVLTWDSRNRIVQADMPVAYDDGHTGREPGQKSVVEWRFRADPGDAWGAPTIHIVEEPRTASYDPPGDGWVQITSYTKRGERTSWQAHVGVVRVVGGVPATPMTRITTTGARRVTTDGAVRITTG